MVFILGKATDTEIAQLQSLGYQVEIGPFCDMTGFYGTTEQQKESDAGCEGLKDIRVYINADVVDVMKAWSDTRRVEPEWEDEPVMMVGASRALEMQRRWHQARMQELNDLQKDKPKEE